MPYKLTRNELSAMEEFAARIKKAHEEIGDAVEDLNTLIEARIEQIDVQIGLLEEIKNEAAGYVADIHSAHEENHDLASEAWQNSDRGEAVREWMLELEGLVSRLEESTEWTGPESVGWDPDLVNEALENVEVEPTN
jgi:hypothetical protein